MEVSQDQRQTNQAQSRSVEWQINSTGVEFKATGLEQWEVTDHTSHLTQEHRYLQQVRAETEFKMMAITLTFVVFVSGCTGFLFVRAIGNWWYGVVQSSPRGEYVQQ